MLNLKHGWWAADSSYITGQVLVVDGGNIIQEAKVAAPSL